MTQIPTSPPEATSSSSPDAGRSRSQPHPDGTALIYLAVALGSMSGGTLRWLIGEWAQSGLGIAHLWATLFANVTGSFLIGLYAALTGPHGRIQAGAVQRHFVVTGVCGGYTTFSLFSLETVTLFAAGDHALAGASLLLSLAGWLGAVTLGFWLGQRLSRRP